MKIFRQKFKDRKKFEFCLKKREISEEMKNFCLFFDDCLRLKSGNFKPVMANMTTMIIN